MLYRIRIEGETPLIQHSSRGLDPFDPLKREAAEIARKKGSNRTEADDARLREIDCALSLWLDHAGNPTIPPRPSDRLSSKPPGSSRRDRR